jgi:hypothetical protein
MAHQSDDARRLIMRTIHATAANCLPTPDPGQAEVWLLHVPFGQMLGEASLAALKRFCDGLHEQSVVAILTAPADAAATWPALAGTMKFHLWVAVKLAMPVERGAGQLPEQHAALLILSKYKTTLRHTKTRIAYTYCPACERTTKDYGGKKHTYHPYGTLVSDVWRDVPWLPTTPPTEIAVRLADLFGLDPYRTLTVVDWTAAGALVARSDPAAPCRKSVTSPQRNSRLIRGDVLRVLKRIPDDSVDFCFADPPYNLDKRYAAWDDALDVHKYFAWCDAWLDELARVLRPGCTCAVLNIPLWAIRHFQHLQAALTFQTWIGWEGLSLPVRMIMPAHYAIVCFSKGPPRPLPGLVDRANELEQQALTTLAEDYCLRQSCVRVRRDERRPISDLWWDIHRLKHNSRRVDHPCQLPPALMRRLIALFTRRGEMVLDPFNGAGTTSLCADALGRHYVGIELSEQYHELARKRHAVLHAGGDPFAKIAATPAAKNSRVARIGGKRYEVSKKTLQLEVRRVAHQLGRMPTRVDVARHGRFAIHYYDEYFTHWGEVCAAARTNGMSETRANA